MKKVLDILAVLNVALLWVDDAEEKCLVGYKDTSIGL